MGLAASQCRLLMLTARKDDVEGSLLKLSNQKLCLARDTAEVAEEYANALNATKLVYKDGDTSFDLTYNTLMRPSSKVDNQYLLTNASGNVLLDDAYAAYFGGGNGQSGADAANSCAKDVFVSNAMGCSVADADKYIAGSTSKSTGGINSTGGSSKFETSYTDAQVFNELDDSGQFFNAFNPDDSHWYSVGNVNAKSCYYNKKPDEAYVVTFSGGSNQTENLAALINQITDDVGVALSKVLGKTGNDFDSLVSSAKAKTQEHYYEKLANDCGNAIRQSTAEGWVSNENGVACSTSSPKTYHVDVNQIIKTFLAYFDSATAKFNGEDNTQYKNEVGEGQSSKTTRPAIGGTNPVSGGGGGGGGGGTGGTDNPTADFYINLYNAIVKNGWKKSSSIDDSSYLQSAIKNGGAYMYQLQKDGSWCLASTSGTDSCISEVADDAAAKKAEAKYNSETAKIEYKEKTIDLQVTNLDTERSALTTQMDSVKKIIEKNIEAFKIFQNA